MLEVDLGDTSCDRLDKIYMLWLNKTKIIRKAYYDSSLIVKCYLIIVFNYLRNLKTIHV